MSAKTLAVSRMDGACPMPAGAYDLASLGYVEEEFLLAGTADAYALSGPRGADGRWSAVADRRAAFVTRIVVRRPADAARFSGAAVVEWNNVSGGVDASPDWTLFHRQIIRRGDAWVGVTAQKAGVDGGGLVEGMHLKAAFPERYGDLVHLGDAFSYDIFTQAGAALRGPGSPLGPLSPSRLIAIGESQSAMHLVTYINAVDPMVGAFDGFLVHGRGASGAALDGTPFASARRDVSADMREVAAERIRDDARVPVLVLQSETDVGLLGGGRCAQPDGSRLRLWEIAGAAHADTYLLVAGAHDDGRLSPERLTELLAPTSQLAIGPTEKPINAAPQQHYVGHAALEALDRWILGGPPPATAERLDMRPDGQGCLLDANGLATGGVRTPWTDVPTAIHSGFGQSGGVFGILFGTTAPLPRGRLEALYPGGQADYLDKFQAALERATHAGFLLKEDHPEVLGLAAAAYPPRS